MPVILHQLVGSLSHYLQGFISQVVVWDFSHQQFSNSDSKTFAYYIRGERHPNRSSTPILHRTSSAAISSVQLPWIYRICTRPPQLCQLCHGCFARNLLKCHPRPRPTNRGGARFAMWKQNTPPATTNKSLIVFWIHNSDFKKK